MKKIKVFLLSAILLFCTLFSLAACGKETSSVEPGHDDKAGGSMVVYVLGGKQYNDAGHYLVFENVSYRMEGDFWSATIDYESDYSAEELTKKIYGFTFQGKSVDGKNVTFFDHVMGKEWQYCDYPLSVTISDSQILLEGPSYTVFIEEGGVKRKVYMGEASGSLDVTTRVFRYPYHLVRP